MKPCVPKGGPSTLATRTAFVIASRKFPSTMGGLAKKPLSLTGPRTKCLRHKGAEWRGIWQWRVPVVLLFGILLSRSAGDGVGLWGSGAAIRGQWVRDADVNVLHGRIGASFQA